MANKDEKQEVYLVEEIKNYSEDMDYEETIVCHQWENFNSFNNIYNLLKKLESQGHDIDVVIKEFIKFFNIAKSQYSLRTRREYRMLYNELMYIKDNLCECEIKNN